MQSCRRKVTYLPYVDKGIKKETIVNKISLKMMVTFSYDVVWQRVK